MSGGVTIESAGINLNICTPGINSSTLKVACGPGIGANFEKVLCAENVRMGLKSSAKES
jgi:hypothetical protein